jgi:hypothetical protein
MLRTGTVVTRNDLTTLGFAPYALSFRTLDFSGANCEWDTLGTVPDSPGLYAFVLCHDDRPGELRVVYVGLTGHIWMVTKGLLPRNGGARAPQRYGRWRHAGQTRAWVNSQVAVAKRDGWDVHHWLAPRPVTDGQKANVVLLPEEKGLIERWKLLANGWNRRYAPRGQEPSACSTSEIGSSRERGERSSAPSRSRRRASRRKQNPKILRHRD